MQIYSTYSPWKFALIYIIVNCKKTSAKYCFLDGANPDEIETEGDSSGSNPDSPQKKQRKESSGSSDLASPVTAPPQQHFGVPPYVTAERIIHSRSMEVQSHLYYNEYYITGSGNK